MLERFSKDCRAVVVDAMTEARAGAEGRIEAEHLLLALARRSEWHAGRVLADVGLDHERLRGALDTEIEQTLEAVGVTTATMRITGSTLPMVGQPRWGTSAKVALGRALTVAQDRGDLHIAPTHILLGVLRAAEGTVPRALASAGVDAADLAARAEATLGETR
jgi:D-alanyl-D-alanine carboxypeptidase